MTDAERRLQDLIRRRAGRIQTELTREELAAYRLIRDSLSERELASAIRDGRVAALLDELLSDRQPLPPFARLRNAIQQSVFDATRLEAKGLPLALGAGQFNMLNPLVIQAVRDLDTRVIDGLRSDVKGTVVQHIEAGIEAGKGPRTVARGVRDVVGLAPNQEAAIRNFERMLREGDIEALTRKLRDHRFDRTLRKALGKDGVGLSEAQIEKMVAAYRKRMVAFNAETHARTVALDAQRLAHRLSWEESIAKGLVNRGDLRRTWIAVGGPTGDGRNRPEHLELHGTTVTWDEHYPNGELVPGDSTFNCRCVERITLAREVAA